MQTRSDKVKLYIKEGLPIQEPEIHIKCKKIDDRLQVVIDHLQLSTQTVTVKKDSAIRKLALEDIYYFESNRRVLVIHTRKGEVTFYGKLDDIQKNLADKDFIRTHQSFLVNALKIKTVKKDSVELSDGEVLPVSKSRATAVKEAYLWSKS